jgi:hypothetical protein
MIDCGIYWNILAAIKVLTTCYLTGQLNCSLCLKLGCGRLVAAKLLSYSTSTEIAWLIPFNNRISRICIGLIAYLLRCMSVVNCGSYWYVLAAIKTLTAGYLACKLNSSLCLKLSFKSISYNVSRKILIFEFVCWTSYIVCIVVTRNYSTW